MTSDPTGKTEFGTTRSSAPTRPRSAHTTSAFPRQVAVAVAAAGLFLIVWKLLELATAVVQMVQRERLLSVLDHGGSLILIVAGGILLLAALLRTITSWAGPQLQQSRERKRLHKATDQARQSVQRKQELMEERIRLASRLRAVWMYERECSRLANEQARREFRTALQSSVTRSCEIAFEQIAMVIDQYESVLQEIQASALESDDKTELLDRLTEQLNVAATEEKNRSAERLMQDEIWKLRMETAERLRKKNPPAALRYLEEVEAATRPCPQRRKLQAVLRRWKNTGDQQSPVPATSD